MPKTIFNIKDESQLTKAITYSVLIPGLKGDKPEKVENLVADGIPTLCRTEKELTNNFGTPKSDGSTKALVMAKALIKQGLEVIFVGFTTAPEKDKLTWSKWIGDRNSNDLRFACTGDFQGLSDGELIKACASRGGCIAVLDCKETYTATEDDTIASLIQKDIANVVTNNNLTDSQTSFATAFAPWGKFDNTTVGSDYNNSYFPGSFAYLMAFANSTIANKNPDGFAAAGNARGIIPGYVEPKYKFDEVDINVLQRKTANSTDLDDIEGVAVNPICYIRTLGNVVWGNRTLKPNTSEASITSKLTWGSFLNIAQIVCDITDKAWLASKKYTFEQNNDVLWVNFKSEITPLLDKLQSGSQILAYRMIKLKSQGRGRLDAQIDITPIEAVEDFKINVNLTDSISVSVE